MKKRTSPLTAGRVYLRKMATISNYTYNTIIIVAKIDTTCTCAPSHCNAAIDVPRKVQPVVTNKYSHQLPLQQKRLEKGFFIDLFV